MISKKKSPEKNQRHPVKPGNTRGNSLKNPIKSIAQNKKKQMNSELNPVKPSKDIGIQ